MATPESKPALTQLANRPHPAAPTATPSSDGAPAENQTEPTYQLGVRIPQTLRKRLRRAAFEQDDSVQAITIAALDAHLSRLGV